MASTGTRVISADVASPLADQVDALTDRRFDLTMEALADVDAGRTVDHAEVEAWIASMDTAMPLPVPACRQSGWVQPTTKKMV
jgi:predicted transcriptional regulator